MENICRVFVKQINRLISNCEDHLQRSIMIGFSEKIKKVVRF